MAVIAPNSRNSGTIRNIRPFFKCKHFARKKYYGCGSLDMKLDAHWRKFILGVKYVDKERCTLIKYADLMKKLY